MNLNFNSNLVQKASLLNQIPSIVKDGNSVIAIDFLKEVTKDNSNFVSAWADYLGGSVEFTQADGSKQPLWTSDGVEFDGFNDFMQTVNFGYEQPEQIYLVVKLKTWTSNLRRLVAGINVNSGFLSTHIANPGINVYAGSYLGLNNDLPINSFALISYLIDGNNSFLKVGNNTKTTGDAGAADMLGITLASSAVDSAHTNIVIKEAIFRKIADTPENETAICNYLKTKYSL